MRRRTRSSDLRPSSEAPARAIVVGLVGLAVLLDATLLFGPTTAVAGSSIDEVLRTGDPSRPVRITGTLVHGSLSRSPKRAECGLGPLCPQAAHERCGFTFLLEGTGTRIPVRYGSCTLPESDCDEPNVDVQVIAVGALDHGEFEASDVFAKSPNKYEAGHKACAADTEAAALRAATK